MISRITLKESYNDEIRNKLLSDCKLISETYNKFNPIISGSAALYLHGIKTRIPEDIDVIFGIPKHKFLRNLGDIKIPNTNFELDWGFYPELFNRIKIIELPYNKSIIRLQNLDSIIDNKLDYAMNINSPKSRKHAIDLLNMHRPMRNKVSTIKYSNITNNLYYA